MVVVLGLVIGGSIGEEHPHLHAGNGTAAQIHQIMTHQPGAAYALVVAASLALLFRRRWPLQVLGVIVVTVGAYAAAGYVPGAAQVAFYVALYTVGTTQRRSTAVVAATISTLILFVTTGIGGPFGWIGGPNVIVVPCAVASVAVGLAMADRRQNLANAVERAERAERDREAEARRRVDAERLRIARELHDVVTHSMSMINVQAGAAVHVIRTQPEVAVEALSAIKEASREGLRELRAILNVLRQVDERDERGPAPRLPQLGELADATTQAGIPTTLSVSADASVLSPAVELAAYRIVQESLTNVLRHAGPDARATVSVTVAHDCLSVRVEDDGAGPLFPDSNEGSGSGLAGMRERAAAFGGHVTAGPRAEGGWRVHAVLPLRSPAGARAEQAPA
jgi:signal transduction histidine kinase